MFGSGEIAIFVQMMMITSPLAKLVLTLLTLRQLVDVEPKERSKDFKILKTSRTMRNKTLLTKIGPD